MGLVRRNDSAPSLIDVDLDGSRLIVREGATVDIENPQSLRVAGLYTARIDFSIAAGGANETLVTITPVDYTGETIGYSRLHVFLSDSVPGVIGESLTAVTASGAVTVSGTTNGMVLGALTAKKCIEVVTNASGVFVLSITDSAKTQFYVNVISSIGTVGVSRQLATGDYG